MIKKGRKRVYDFDALKKVGDTLTITTGNAESVRAAAWYYSQVNHSGVRKYTAQYVGNSIIVLRTK